MKILLLIPPTDLAKSYGWLKKFSNPQPSIGTAYIAAVLRQHGYEAKVVDAYVNEYTPSNLIDIIETYSPDVLGISVLTPTAEIVYEISRNIRNKFPKIRMVMGNMHASLFADEILSKNYADFVIHSEGELTMLELIKTIENNGNLEGILGVSFKKNGIVVHNPSRPHIEDLDRLPFPAWDLFPLERYSTDPRTEVKSGAVEMQILASRGCPNQCTFCSSRTERSLGSKYRMRDPNSIVDEMIYMYERYGSEIFSFMDLAFPLVREHAIEVCNELIKRRFNKKLRWMTECRVKPLDINLLTLMKKAGCVRICFGIESGNNRILKALRKNFTVEDVKSAVKMAHKAGLTIDGMFMIGLPGETEKMINETISFAIGLNLRYAIFNIFVPYPGCELYDNLKAENKIHYKSWSDFTSYSAYSGGVPVYAPDGLSKEKVMGLQKKAMRRFYLRPRFIINELINFKIDKIGHYIEGLKGVLYNS